jgi:hypothetical protein
MCAKRARTAVLLAATQASEPDHLVPVMSGWGWHAYIAQHPEEHEDVVAIRDFYLNSGWDYSRRTRTWRRIAGVPLADTLPPTDPVGVAFVATIAAGLLASVYARSKSRSGAA